mgnify:CR=1 FL=1
MTEQKDALGRPRSKYQTVNTMPSETVQADSDKADINKILKRYREVGIMDQLNLTEAHFPDVSELGDFQDVMQIARTAETEFMKLPSKVREIFNHDVAKWLDTAHDEEKRTSLIEKGIIESDEKPAPSHPPDGGAGNEKPEDPNA